jgi:hypothetical protein
MSNFEDWSEGVQREHVAACLGFAPYDDCGDKQQDTIDDLVIFHAKFGRDKFLMRVHEMMTPPPPPPQNVVIENLEQRVAIKQAFIDDAKSKIREMNLEYFGVGSDKLSVLKTELEKMMRQLEGVAETLEQYFDEKISREEAKTKIKDITK